VIKERVDLRWGVECRPEFIEFLLFWEGYVNRGDMMEAFGVSVTRRPPIWATPSTWCRIP